jgi:site-specific recombinase XerD
VNQTTSNQHLAPNPLSRPSDAHATPLLASGVHPKIASERLGHTKVGITLDLYWHVLPNMLIDAVALLDDASRRPYRSFPTKYIG